MTTAQLPEITKEERAQLDDLCARFAETHMTALWTRIGGLTPTGPRPDAEPVLWHRSALLFLAERAGERVPVGRGGERRAIALANSRCGTGTVGHETYDVGDGDPFAVPSWASMSFRTDTGLDASRFSDDPVFEALGLSRTSREALAP